jgi:hypothetical protein
LVCWQTSFHEDTVFISPKLSRRNLTVRILHGGFTKSRKPSDLTEEQRSYGRIHPVQDRENQIIGSEPMRTIGFAREIPFRGFGTGKVKGFISMFAKS